MWRLSGRFYKWSWRFWAASGAEDPRPGAGPELPRDLWPDLGDVPPDPLGLPGDLRLRTHRLRPGLAVRDEAGPVKFSGLLYMSASTFLTLGLGDVTSPHPFDRFLVIIEAATGFIFLGLIITYMPLLDQAYSAREVGNLLHPLAGRQSAHGHPARCTDTPTATTPRSSGAICARASAGWPRPSRAISHTRCSRFTGRSTSDSPGWSR